MPMGFVPLPSVVPWSDSSSNDEKLVQLVKLLVLNAGAVRVMLCEVAA